MKDMSAVLRSTLLFLSAVVGAFLVILALRHGVELPAVSSASALGVSAPMVAVALAFPAIYLLWEQSEL